MHRPRGAAVGRLPHRPHLLLLLQLRLPRLRLVARQRARLHHPADHRLHLRRRQQRAAHRLVRLGRFAVARRDPVRDR